MEQVIQKRIITCDYNSESFSSEVCLGLLEKRYDLQFMYELINNRSSQQWLGTQLPITLGDEEKFFEMSFRENSKSHTFGIFLKHKHNEKISHELIGVMGLSDIHLIDGYAGTGSNIHPDFQSKGYGFQAKMLLLDYAFNRVGLRKICSTAHSENAKSVEHNKKAGYKVIGTYEKHRFVNGEYRDTIILECFKSDWQLVWNKFITGEFKKSV